MISKDLLNAIDAIDLKPIKFRLMHPSVGEGWSVAKTDAIEREYRRFLYLSVSFPDEKAAPSVDVDTFWHYHILDTCKYLADCEQAFGYFLHHYPYLGMLDSDAPGAVERAAEKTRALYEAVFGAPDMGAWADASEAVPQQARGHTAARCNALCLSTRRPSELSKVSTEAEAPMPTTLSLGIQALAQRASAGQARRTRAGAR